MPNETLEEFLSAQCLSNSLEEFFSLFLLRVAIEESFQEILRGSPNETSFWISSQGPELLEVLKSHLSKKMPKSFALGKIDDHVSKFLEDLIRRDSIGKRNRKGVKTHLSQVRAWALRNAHTQNRDAGTDVLTRTVHGALTKKEWESPDHSVEFWTTRTVPNDYTLLENVPIEDDSLSSLEDSESFKALLGKIRGVLSKNVEEDELPLYMNVLVSFFVRKDKVSEISSEFGVEPRRVTAIVSKIKKTLKSERALFSLD